MNTMMRTTVYLPMDLVQLAKAHALASRTNVTKLVEEGLRKKLRVRTKKVKTSAWPTYHLGAMAAFGRTDLYEQTLAHRVR